MHSLVSWQYTVVDMEWYFSSKRKYEEIMINYLKNIKLISFTIKRDWLMIRQAIFLKVQWKLYLFFVNCLSDRFYLLSFKVWICRTWMAILNDRFQFLARSLLLELAWVETGTANTQDGCTRKIQTIKMRTKTCLAWAMHQMWIVDMAP